MKMHQALKLVTSLSVTLTTGLAQAASFDEAIKNATTTGQFGLGYISVAPDVAGAKNTTAAAVSGQLKFETAPWNNVQFAVAPYFTEKLAMLSGDKTRLELNTDFFNANSDSYAYVAEAYVHYAWSNGSARLGRQKLDTPFINTDETRLQPNTFNAAWFNFSLSKALTLDAGTVSHWAGPGAGSKDKFIKAKTDGVNAVGLSYTHSDSLTAQGWYYDFAKQYSLLYADLNYTQNAFSVGGQYASYSEKNASNVAGSVIGLNVSYSNGALTLGAVMNKGSNATGKSADLGLGGGNFYTGMDDSNIGGLNEALAYVLKAEYAATSDLTITVARGHFEDKTKATNKDETNLVLGYSVKENLNIEFVHTMVDNKGNQTDEATNFSRNFARVNYTF